MPDILLSIRARWLRMIFDGDKTAELRKSRPNEDMVIPFKVYFYETRAGGRGAVVGEGLCYIIEKAEKPPYSYGLVLCSGLMAQDIAEYSKGKPIYGWYLSKVTEYKTPLPLFDFGLSRAPQSWCYVKEAA